MFPSLSLPARLAVCRCQRGRSSDGDLEDTWSGIAYRPACLLQYILGLCVVLSLYCCPASLYPNGALIPPLLFSSSSSSSNLERRAGVNGRSLLLVIILLFSLTQQSLEFALQRFLLDSFFP